MSTRSLLPPAWVALEQALGERRPVWLSYHGRRRLVSPHALGWNKARLVVLGYQHDTTERATRSPVDAQTRWRCMFIDEIEHVAPAEKTDAWQSADNYDPKQPFSAIESVIVAAEPSGDGT
jgi:hypothetical protein